MDIVNEKNIEKNERIRRAILEILGSILGALVMAIGVSLFLLPNQLSSGGVSGIATYYVLSVKYTNGYYDFNCKYSFVCSCYF